MDSSQYIRKPLNTTTSSAKAFKGTVTVESVDGRLRLRFRVAGKPYTITLGVSDIMSDLILMSLRAERGNPKPLLAQLLETLREHSTSLHSQ